jgi:hypothetical protein
MRVHDSTLLSLVGQSDIPQVPPHAGAVRDDKCSPDGQCIELLSVRSQYSRCT